MEANLKFVLPDDQTEFEACINGNKWKSVCWEFDQYLRSKIKYGYDFKSTDEAFEAIRLRFNDLIQEQSLNIGDL